MLPPVILSQRVNGSMPFIHTLRSLNGFVGGDRSSELLPRTETVPVAERARNPRPMTFQGCITSNVLKGSGNSQKKKKKSKIDKGPRFLSSSGLLGMRVLFIQTNVLIILVNVIQTSQLGGWNFEEFPR